MTSANLAPSTPAVIAQVALTRLAAEFDPLDFSATLNADDGQPSSLTVASLRCPLTDDVLVEGELFWFAWGEPVGPVNDPAAAASKIARVLRAAPEPSHG